MTVLSIASSTVMAGANECLAPGIQKLISKPKNTSKKFLAQVEAAVATREAVDERPVLIMAQDEGCFGLISRAKRCWAAPGVRPHVPSQVVREYNLYLCCRGSPRGLDDLADFARASTEMMNLFLEHFSQTYSKFFLVMQVDQAGWHHARELVIPSNIRLI